MMNSYYKFKEKQQTEQDKSMNQCKASHVFPSLARGVDWTLESRIQLKESGNIVPLTMISGSSTQNPESTARGPEYQCVLDSITWGNTRKYLLVDSERYSDRGVDRLSTDMSTQERPIVSTESLSRDALKKNTHDQTSFEQSPLLRISSIGSKVGTTFTVPVQHNKTGHHRKFLLSNL